MAVRVALAPYPSETAVANRTAARACLRAGIVGGRSTSLTDDRVDALGMAAGDIVTRFAPDAPVWVKNEAAIRVAGWLHAKRPNTMQSFAAETIRVDMRVRDRFPDALANSGARAILAPWRARRALPIEDAS